MASTSLSLENATRDNTNYRRVLHTTSTSQIVLYSLEGGEDIPPETHSDTTQIIYAVDGHGEVIFDSTTRLLPRDGDTIVVAPKTLHVVRAIGTAPFKFWSVYSPPVFNTGHTDERQPLSG